MPSLSLIRSISSKKIDPIVFSLASGRGWLAEMLPAFFSESAGDKLAEKLISYRKETEIQKNSGVDSYQKILPSKDIL
ncbi:hypothetical protein CEXT_577301 [Caerostris extrusa]|uniref:Uncharacterized protein n=1 Tax=Caerostris extrusa TaxID=172846 RepID=A0AAV4VLY6_CAEEX|nr:hypothetical protein CEXT_577301 [Caerostris extrusa]